MIRNNFCRNLKKHADIHYGYRGGVNDLAVLLDISQGQMSNILAGRKCGDETWRRMVSEKIGINYNTMIGVKPCSENNVIHFEDAYDKKHYEVTKMFKKKDRAIEINEKLVEIEKLDPDELEEIKDIISFKLKKLYRKHGKKGDAKRTGTLGES